MTTIYKLLFDTKYFIIGCFILLVTTFNYYLIAQEDIEIEKKDFEFVVHEIENNYSGFAFKINDSNIEQYKSLKSKLINEIEKENRSGIDAGAELVAYFNDFHFSLGSPTIHSSKYMVKKHKDYGKYIKDYNPKFVCKKVTPKTFLIRIPNYWYTEENRNFVIKAVEEFKVSGCEYLIIDERKNPGGHDGIFHPLVYLLSQHKGYFHSYKWLNTKENRNFIDTSWRKDYPSLTEKLVTQMDASKDKYLVLDNDSLYSIDSVNMSILPKQTAIIIDNNVASSGEFLIIYLRACSERFMVYGKENSLGCLDFANTKSMLLPSKRGGINVPISCPIGNNFIDDTGISPDVYIPIDYPTTLTDNIDSWTIWVANDLENSNKEINE